MLTVVKWIDLTSYIDSYPHESLEHLVLRGFLLGLQQSWQSLPRRVGAELNRALCPCRRIHSPINLSAMAAVSFLRTRSQRLASQLHLFDPARLVTPLAKQTEIVCPPTCPKESLRIPGCSGKYGNDLQASGVLQRWILGKFTPKTSSLFLFD